MQQTLYNDIEIFNISAPTPAADTAGDRRRRRPRKRESRLAKQINLIHEFSMPNFSTHVTATADQKYLFALGSYKPRIKCYELENMSEKFTRGVDALPHKIQLVGADWRRFWLIEDDRWLEYHGQQGQILRERIPKPCRDIAFAGPQNHIYVTAAGPEVYRFNMTVGQFLPPLTSPSGADQTKCAWSPVNGLVVCGSAGGTVDAWDPRAPRCVATLTAGASGEEVSCLRFKDGFNLGVGLSTGRVLLFDVRSAAPRLAKEHHYSFPILDLDFHSHEEPKVVSMDKKCVKIWRDEEGAPTWAALEPGVNLNGFHVWRNCGLIHLANEGPQLLSYYIPQLGPAPSWCSLLYLLLEEFEAEDRTLFEGQRFVSRGQVEQWGMGSLIGSELTAHMHGFRVDERLYAGLREAFGPISREEEAEARVDELLRQRRDAVAIRVEEGETDIDERFRALRTDPEFAVDPESEEAGKAQRLRRIKERKLAKRLRAREKAARSDRLTA